MDLKTEVEDALVLVRSAGDEGESKPLEPKEHLLGSVCCGSSEGCTLKALGIG